MTDLTSSYICLGLGVILIIMQLARGGMKDLMTPLSLFYFYFAFGPVINYVSGINIYFGTPKEYIPEACIIFLLALGTMTIGSLIWPQAKIEHINHDVKPLWTLKPIYIFSILYAIYASLIVIMGGGQTKVEKIALAIPGLHYNYLMIQIYLISFYFLINDKKIKFLFYINTLMYIVYSLVIGERDFIFPIISIVFHRSLFQPRTKTANIKLIISLVGMMGLATAIFFFRDASQSSEGVISAILNQGSLLFINTFSIKLLNERIDYFMGYTYLNSLLNLLPSWIYKTNFNTLDWFKNSYAAASTSGYGFGLDAEGYLNFSYLGVLITFSIILFIQRKISKHINGHPFFLYYSVFFSAFTMYSLRNDSLAFMKGNLYAIIFFYLVYKFSWSDEVK